MPMDVQESRLENGVRVVTASMPRVESVSLGILVGVGGRHETNKRAGMSHFLEHMLFKGTRKRTASDISMAIEGRGGYLNAYTQTDSTCYFARVAYENTWDSLDVLSDMYLHSNFNAVEVKKEAAVIVEEIMMYKDQPHHLVQEMMAEALWSGHPVGRSLSGTPEAVLGFSSSDLKEYRRKMYVPANTVVTFAGRVDHEECVKHVTRLLGRMSAASLPRCKPMAQKVGITPVALVEKPIEQAHLAMGIRVFGRKDRRRYALKLLSVILGGNMSSRLFQNLREKHGLAYSIHSSANLLSDTGVFYVSAGLDRSRYRMALKLIFKELARIRDKRVSVNELERARDYAVGQIRLSLESTMSQMSWSSENVLYYDRFVAPEKAMARLRSVTREDIQAVARYLMQGRKMSVAMVLPEVTDTDRDLILALRKGL